VIGLALAVNPGRIPHDAADDYLTLTQGEAGRFLHIEERTSRRWATGDREVPWVVAALLSADARTQHFRRRRAAADGRRLAMAPSNNERIAPAERDMFRPGDRELLAAPAYTESDETLDVLYLF
jgi:hypothetical protein